MKYRDRIPDVYCLDDGRRRVVIVTGRETLAGHPARITVYRAGARIAVSGHLRLQGGEWVFAATPRGANWEAIGHK